VIHCEACWEPTGEWTNVWVQDDSRYIKVTGMLKMCAKCYRSHKGDANMSDENRSPDTPDEISERVGNAIMVAKLARDALVSKKESKGVEFIGLVRAYDDACRLLGATMIEAAILEGDLPEAPQAEDRALRIGQKEKNDDRSQRSS
jgi:hypothetical protein